MFGINLKLNETKRVNLFIFKLIYNLNLIKKYLFYIIFINYKYNNLLNFFVILKFIISQLLINKKGN